MSKKSTDKKYQPLALAALKRAAKEAVELARRTNTSAWVMMDGKIVDATKLPIVKAKKPAKKVVKREPRNTKRQPKPS